MLEKCARLGSPPFRPKGLNELSAAPHFCLPLRRQLGELYRVNDDESCMTLGTIYTLSRGCNKRKMFDDLSWQQNVNLAWLRLCSCLGLLVRSSERGLAHAYSMLNGQAQ
jgi:hypothetical protein